MPTKTALYDRDGQQRFLRGVNALAGAVKVTVGPNRRDVVIERSRGASLQPLTELGRE